MADMSAKSIITEDPIFSQQRNERETDKNIALEGLCHGPIIKLPGGMLPPNIMSPDLNAIPPSDRKPPPIHRDAQNASSMSFDRGKA